MAQATQLVPGASPRESRPELLGRAMGLWTGLVLLGALAVLVLWAMLRAQRRGLGRSERKRRVRRPAIASAWEEAGRRAEGVTVDLEPDAVRSSAAGGPVASGHAQPAEAPRPDRRPGAGVTGFSKRVGLAIAMALARRGCDLILTYRSDEGHARAMAAELERRGVATLLRRVDLDDLSQAEMFAREIAASAPRVDVLVHNASAYEPTPLSELSGDDLLRHYRVNAAAPAILTRHLAPLLARSPLPGGGAIVALADMHVLGRPRKDHLAYAMSKAALVEMVRTLARELGPTVRVNAVAPGVVAFPEQGPEADPEFQKRYLSRVPLGRSGTPDDAADAVCWLALDARYVTGEVIRVDGGRWLA
ncbi:SDR family oxidoreductase [Leptolyngbya sp. 15MV]|nr:SDR family oxidoreductase [Leptolyngbya sp. 15MV]